MMRTVLRGGVREKWAKLQTQVWNYVVVSARKWQNLKFKENKKKNTWQKQTRALRMLKKWITKKNKRAWNKSRN